jgi:hypothetical protein
MGVDIVNPSKVGSPTFYMRDERVEWWVDLDLLKISSNLAKKYKGYVEYDDFKQELTGWCLEDEKRAARLWAAPWWFRNRRLWTIGERYARKVKAQALGYEIEDEFFYSPEVLKRLLPDVFDHDSEAPVKGTEEVKGKAELTMEWETMIADVRRALELIGNADFELLWAVHGEQGATLNGHAEVKGWDGLTAWRRYRKALRRLSDLLGGQIPWAEDVTKDYQEGPVKGPESPVGATELVGGEVG